MDSNTLPVGKVFGQDRRLIVPLFQRPYVWNQEDQWEPLWSDILNVADRWSEGQDVKPHFLGAIVLDAQRRPIGHLETRLIIDGQQRLTTLQLLYEAFCDICAEAEEDKYHRALLKLTRNDDPMSEDADEVFKVWPTTVDQVHFRRVMTASSPSQVIATYGPPSAGNAQHPLAKCYLFFHSEILEWLKPNEAGFEDRLKVLYEVLRVGLRVVAIDLDDLDDPQVIFETLNARGTPLLPADLVKNHLFYKASLEGRDMETLYTKYWRSFDVNDGYWRKELGRGHARRARIDLFLQYYLTARKRNEVSTTHLYVSFREYVSNSGTAVEHLAQIQKYSSIYEHFDGWAEDSRERLFFERLGAMDIASAQPFILELFATYEGDHQEIVKVLTDVESFLVRRMICGLNTRGYNRLFVDMLGSLEGDGLVAERVRKFLLSSTAASNRWPDDKEFEDAWISKPVYETLVQRRVRMLLEAIELQLRTSKTESIAYKKKLQIEHLLPREWRKYWPLPDGSDEQAANEQRNAAIQTIGNLTLLTEALNPSVSNGPWKKKCKDILEHSALNLNRKLDPLEWNENSIRQRAVELFQAAKQIWPHPGRPVEITK
jgi:uncharacterized protein with ParB-like and HNH nuclease domain